MDTARQLVLIAEREIGYLEKASAAGLDEKTANAGSNNYTKYGAWYPMQAQPWCAVFVSWCAFQAGIGAEIIPKHASCTVGINWFKQHGAWRERNGYKPRPGDILYFADSRGNPCHVGIVSSSDNKNVYTVEGNTSTKAGVVANGGGVAAKSYALGYAGILGYGTPKYEEDENMTQEQFNEMAGNWINSLAKIEPAKWSQCAREWAEKNGILHGDENGNKQYKKFTTREELVQVLYNMAQNK